MKSVVASHFLPPAAREQPEREGDTKEAAVKAHATVPHLDDVGGMGEVEVGLVKQHIAQAPAQHYAQHAVSEHVVEVFLGPVQPGLGVDAPAPQYDDQNEGQQVHKAVPMYRQRADMEGDGVDVWMDEHGDGVR